MRGLLGRGMVVGLAVALLAGACSGGGQQVAGEGDAPGGAVRPAAPGGSVLSTVGEAGSGQGTSFTVRLSEGAGGDESDVESPPAVNRVEGTALGDEEIRAVLDRLPPWEADEADAVAFNRPAESLPPPRTGRTVDQPFPAGPDIAAPIVADGPLEVLRVQPEGEVGIAPFISITFSQPMAPLTTLDQLDALDVPVEITPSLPGRWQWIGTRTLRFEHDQAIFDRLPMATSYTVEIPAGTRSQTGGELAETFGFEFETPPPSVTRLTPEHDSLGLEPVFLATFDQRVEPAAVLDVITLLADGREREIRLATAAEIEGDEWVDQWVSYYVEQALEDTWVAFRPAAPLEPDSPIRITVGPHVPSAEGPNTSGDSSTIDARTYAPLRVAGTNCSSWPCPPGSALEVYFNNRLDAATVDAADITVTPGISDATISAYGSSLTIDGPTAGGAVYEVVIPATVGDEFGQTLGDPETVVFQIEEADPLIWYLGGGFATVDPLGVRQTTPVVVRQWEELRVRLYAVDSDDFQSYLNFLSRAGYQRVLPEAAVPWALVTDETIRTGIRDDALTEVPIDLSGALKGAHGHVVMIVEGAGRLAETADLYRSARVIAWIQDTDIGVDLVEDGLDVVVWTTDLRSGDPLAGVEIQLGDRRPPLVTDADGLVRAATGADGFEGIVASLGADRALSPVIVWESLEDQTIWYTADDRGMYRPGETVRLKGWVRHLDLTGDGGLEFFPPGALITYTASGPFGNEIGSGVVRIDEHGGFDLSLVLREGANLGWSRIEFQLTGVGAGDDARHTHTFQVQEFRRPEFEVEARVESAGPHFIDEPAEVAVDARYFSGGALPNAEVTWWVITRRGSYSPPNWPDFTFGVWRPWWHYDDGHRSSEVGQFTGTTGADGSHYLRIDIEDDGADLPLAVTAEATVIDVNRQGWSASTDFLVHSADLYVGIRSTRTFVSAGDGIDIESIVTDLDGEPVAGRALEVTAERLDWRHMDGKWAEVALDSETCETTSGRAPVVCEFAAAEGGRYRISARVIDDSGRRSRSEMTRWVSGAKDSVPSRGVELEAVNLVPGSETLAAGDTAEILVGSPFASATGLLTVVHSRIIETRTFEVTNHTAVLRVPITEGHVPELKLRVDLAAVTDRTGDDGTVLTGVPPRPAHASGEILLRVPPVQRTLEVVAAPAAAVLQPGAATSVAVQVNDAAGVPVAGAGVLVIVVDEAVLALSGYELIDPIDVFYRRRAAALSAVRGRDTILLEDLQGLRDRLEAAGFDERGRVATAAAAPEEADSADGAAVLLVAVREDLDALALFEPGAATDADGRVVVEFELPDSLTRYRVMAVAVHGADRFGTGESAVTARLPLQVRPSAPRFLNYGDRFELPIVVQNQTDAAVEADVVVQTSNLEILGSAGRRVAVPANDRVEVRFPARTASPGVARFRVAAISGDHADAQVVSLPVYTPATSEAFAVYGVVDEGAVIQPIAAPEDVIPQFGGLEVNTSSTALQALTDAVLYLADYRYASSDAYAGRIMAISALADVLGAFEAEGLPSPAELDARVRSDIAELSSLQNYDGGFGWLSRDGVSHPYSSIQAMHALAVASDNRFEVRAGVLADGLWYLQTIEDRFPDYYGRRIKDTLTAYALRVRSLHGERVGIEARSLWNRRGEALGLDALAWLWPVVDDDGIEAEIERLLNNRAVETAGAATFATDYGEDAYLLLHSDRRTDGIVLDALIEMVPRSDLIPKVVAGLLGHRVRGRWNNIQENTFILLALKRYFDTFEAVDPDFVARVWLGDLYAAEHTYAGRSTDRGATLIPMAELLAAGDTDLVVAKDGEGRLYYRLGLRYAPDDLDLEPLDRGFVVQRSYEAVGDPADVRLNDDGVWHIRAGAEVRVNVTMVNDSRRTNMALVDPLAAGFEILNPALAVTGEVDARGDSGWWRWTWYRHQNLRDDRAEAFASYLWAGTHEYSYVVRATTPGAFVVPPAEAEEIYAPEVFGRSATDRVIISDSR